uniref:tRNA-intron lyase n=1 Tax=Ditylenchus dipsaci TaxID=166011 RepID=A0A915DYI4_9BILA
METSDDLPLFDFKLSVDEAWARVQAMCTSEQPVFPLLNIDQIGLHSFVVVDQNDVKLLKDRYRMIADSFSRNRPLVSFSSARLLPEQTQILLENGFAQVRKISNIQPLSSIHQYQSYSVEEPIEEQFSQHPENESSLRVTAVKMVLEDRNEADALCATEDEVKSAMQELRLRTREKHIEESARWRLPPCNLSYELISDPEFPSDPVYLTRLQTFRDLWRKGFYLTNGTKFGCDYLAYTKPPGEEHSRFMVICMGAESSKSSIDLIAISRVASQVQKKMNWWKGNR